MSLEREADLAPVGQGELLAESGVVGPRGTLPQGGALVPRDALVAGGLCSQGSSMTLQASSVKKASHAGRASGVELQGGLPFF